MLARARRPYGLASSDVLGAVEAARLAAGMAEGRISGLDSTLNHLAEPLPTIGVGQPVSMARGILGADGTALVLVDGRAVSLITGEDLRLRAVELSS